MTRPMTNFTLKINHKLDMFVSVLFLNSFSSQTHARTHAQRSWMESELFQAPEKRTNKRKPKMIYDEPNERELHIRCLLFFVIQIPSEGIVQEIVIKLRRRTKKINEWEESVFGSERARWRFVEVARWVLLVDCFLNIFARIVVLFEDIVSDTADIRPDGSHSEWQKGIHWKRAASPYCVWIFLLSRVDVWVRRRPRHTGDMDEHSDRERDCVASDC